MKSLRKSLLLLILLIIIFICIPLKDIINEPSIIQQEISAPLDFFCFHKEASLFQLIVSKEVCTVENVIADSASGKVAWFSHLYYFRSWDFDNNSIFYRGLFFNMIGDWIFISKFRSDIIKSSFVWVLIAKNGYFIDYSWCSFCYSFLVLQVMLQSKTFGT